jgi:N-acetylmuramic acid 6-phosphate (MurNAc-6-P) etherase
MKPTNDKLVKRAVRVVGDMAGVDEKTAIAALDENGWDVKKSVKAIESK